MQIDRDLILRETSFMFFFILFHTKRSEINLDFFLLFRDFIWSWTPLPLQFHLIKLIERHSIERGTKNANFSFINTIFNSHGHSLTFVDHDCQEHQGPVNDLIYSSFSSSSCNATARKEEDRAQYEWMKNEFSLMEVSYHCALVTCTK